MASSLPAPTGQMRQTDSEDKTFPMEDDRVVGDGGNMTVYERPDGSQYALDHNGRGVEWPVGDPIFGRARFDAREQSSGRWEGSLCTPQEKLDETGATGSRARSHGRPKPV